MHRLRRTAIALAIGETVALSASAPSSAQTATQPDQAPTQPADAIQQSLPNQATESATPGSPGSEAKARPANIRGGYTWRAKPSTKSSLPPRQKVDPTRPQAKGPEFVIGADGTSHISVQLSRRVDVSLTTNPGQLVFELPNTQVAIPNDSNPLVTTHFVTPVKTVRLVTHGKSARLVIELRQAAVPRFELRQVADAAVVLEVSIPKPTGSAAAPSGEPRRPASPRKSRK